MYYYFTIEDSAGVPGLIHEGACELTMDPVDQGKVQLTLLVRGEPFGECKDTTSVWQAPNARSRWQLSWGATGNKCMASIKRLPSKSSPNKH